MKRLLISAVIAAAALAPFDASAQTAQTAQAAPAAPVIELSEADRVALARIEQLQSLMNEATVVMAPLAGDQSFAQVKTADDLAAAIVRLRPQIENALAVMQSLRTRLEALTPIVEERGSNYTSAARQIERDAVDQIAGFSDFLSAFAAFLNAAETGDREAAAARAVEMRNGGLLMIRSQAAILRARKPLAASHPATMESLEGMALMYDGFAALLAGATDAQPAAEAAAKVKAAAADIRAVVARGRRASAENPIVAILAGPAEAALIERLRVARLKSFDVLERAAALLEGGGGEPTFTAQFAQSFTAVEQELQAIETEIITIMSAATQGG